MPFTLPPDANGILPDRMIAAMADAGLILPEYPFVESQIQPASLDLRLGNIAYRVRASFLPGPGSTVAATNVFASAAVGPGACEPDFGPAYTIEHRRQTLEDCGTFAG